MIKNTKFYWLGFIVGSYECPNNIEGSILQNPYLKQTEQWIDWKEGYIDALDEKNVTLVECGSNYTETPEYKLARQEYEAQN